MCSRRPDVPDGTRKAWRAVSWGWECSDAFHINERYLLLPFTPLQLTEVSGRTLCLRTAREACLRRRNGGWAEPRFEGCRSKGILAYFVPLAMRTGGRLARRSDPSCAQERNLVPCVSRSEGARSSQSLPPAQSLHGRSIPRGPRAAPQNAGHLLTLTPKLTSRKSGQTHTARDPPVRAPPSLPGKPAPSRARSIRTPTSELRPPMSLQRPASGFNDHRLEETYLETREGRRSVCFGQREDGVLCLKPSSFRFVKPATADACQVGLSQCSRVMGREDRRWKRLSSTTLGGRRPSSHAGRRTSLPERKA